MASRKKPGMILKRDHAFTEAIGKPGSREPNAFSMASEDAKAKLEAAQARGLIDLFWSQRKPPEILARQRSSSNPTLLSRWIGTTLQTPDGPKIGLSPLKPLQPSHPSLKALVEDHWEVETTVRLPCSARPSRKKQESGEK